jgi:type IV pilus assembly protein PilM
MKTVGVDIAAGAVRVAVVNGIDSRGFAVVSRIGMVPYRDGVVEGGHVRQPVVVAQALVAALRQAGAPRYGFILGYAAPEVATTRISMPSAIKPEERVTTIRTSNIQIAPTLPLEDSIIDANYVRTLTTAEGVSIDTLVVAAAQRSEVDALKSLMSLARCEPRAIDLSAAALMRALVRTPSTSVEVHTVIDIGATKTTVATRQGPHLRSVRVIPVGGLNITRAIMAATSDTADQAEKRKTFMRLSNAAEPEPVSLPLAYGTDKPEAVTVDNETRMDEAVNNVVNDLIEQIAASIENDASGFGNQFTQGVVLSGLTAQIPGLKERINQRLGVQVQLGRPWARIEPSRANAQYLVGGPDNPRPLLDLSTAIGLALWRKGGAL